MTAIAEPVTGAGSGAQSATETTVAHETCNPESRVAERASRAPFSATRSAAERPAIATVALMMIEAFTADATHGHALGDAEADAPVLQLLVAVAVAVFVAVAVLDSGDETDGEREGVSVRD